MERFCIPAPPLGVVELTLAWLNQSRRLSKNYERLPKSSEAMMRKLQLGCSCCSYSSDL
jgi:transposase